MRLGQAAGRGRTVVVAGKGGGVGLGVENLSVSDEAESEFLLAPLLYDANPSI